MVQIVLFLNRQPGSSQDELVAFLGIDKSGVARKCRQLEDLDYIRREQSQADRRQNRLFLTDKGMELVPLIRERLQKWRERMIGEMDALDQKALLHLLEYMMNNAAKADDP